MTHCTDTAKTSANFRNAYKFATLCTEDKKYEVFKSYHMSLIYTVDLNRVLDICINLSYSDTHSSFYLQ